MVAENECPGAVKTQVSIDLESTQYAPGDSDANKYDAPYKEFISKLKLKKYPLK